MDNFKDPIFRKRFMHWIWLPVVIFSVGLVMSLSGPTFPDLQLITNTGQKMASFFFTATSCGYMVGATLIGILYGKVDTNIMMTFLAVSVGCVTLWTPYASHFSLMLLSRFLVGTALGGIDAAVNVEHMRIWGDSGEALLQALHFMYAAGCSVGPPISEPFLLEKVMKNRTEEKANNSNNFIPILSYNVTGEGNTLDQTQVLNLTVTDAAQLKTSNVRYAFFIAAIISISTSIPFIVMLLVDKRQKQSGTPLSPKQKYGQKEPKRKLPKLMSLVIISMMCVYYVCYCSVEYTVNFYLMTFVLDRFEEATTADGVYSTTMFWVAFFVGRFVSIFAAKWLRAVRVLALYLGVMFIAFIGVYFSGHFGGLIALKVFTCLGGLSASAIFPAGLSWMEAELMMVTERTISIFYVAFSIGTMLMGYLVGYLMETFSVMWFCYICLGSTTILVLTFFSLLLFNRCYLNKKYGTISEGKAMETNIEVEVISPLQPQNV